jgi:hypothetical protein
MFKKRILFSFLKENFANMQIFLAMLLGPFEQLEREFGWEGQNFLLLVSQL